MAQVFASDYAVKKSGMFYFWCFYPKAVLDVKIHQSRLMFQEEFNKNVESIDRN